MADGFCFDCTVVDLTHLWPCSKVLFVSWYLMFVFFLTLQDFMSFGRMWAMIPLIHSHDALSGLGSLLGGPIDSLS